MIDPITGNPKINLHTGRVIQEQFDDLKRDNPSCGAGVQKRLMIPLRLLPSMHNIPVLNDEELKIRLLSTMVLKNDDMP